MSKMLSHEQRATNGNRQATPKSEVQSAPAPAMAKGGPGELGVRSKAPQGQVPFGHSELKIPHSALRAPAFSSQEVFSINFIRREVVPFRVRRVLVYAGFGSLVINLALMIGLLVFAGQTRHEAQRVRVQMGVNTARAPNDEMETLRERTADNLARLNTLIGLQRSRFYVGSKLAALTRTLPARTWITSLSSERKGRTLLIHACYLVNSEKPYDLPTKGWIEALKADPVFGQGLTRLELAGTSRKRQGDAELFTFDLTAAWNP